MILFEYLDHLPRVPDALVDQVLTTIQHSPVDFAVPSRAVYIDHNLVENITYNRHHPIAELTEWIHKNISDQYVSFGVQVHTPKQHSHTHFPHTDTAPRHWALNCNLEPGGLDVTTCWYQEQGYPMIRPGPTRPENINQLELLQSVVIQSRRWHVINTQVLHAVHNIEQPRIAITLGFENNPWEHVGVD